MKYKKTEMETYNIHEIKTDKFKTISVLFSYRIEIEKEKLLMYDILIDLLATSSLKFNTIRKLAKEKENLYVPKFKFSDYVSGKYMVLNFSLKFLNEKYTEEGMNEKTIAFLMDNIYSPNVSNFSFDSKLFNIFKASQIDYINSLKEDPNNYAIQKLNTIIGKNTSLECNYLNSAQYIDKSTSENAYKLYEEIIKKGILNIIVLGDIDNAKEIISNNIKAPTKKRDAVSPVQSIEKKEAKEIIESTPFSQSKLKVVYTIEDITKEEMKYTIFALNYILGGSPDSKLFKEVREKNSLCYNINSTSNNIYNILVVSAGIDKSNYEKTLKLINKQVNSIVHGHFTKEDVKKAKITFKTACCELFDEPESIINMYLVNEYLQTDLYEDRLINIEKTNKKKIVSLAKKLRLHTIFLLKGEDNSEN